MAAGAPWNKSESRSLRSSSSAQSFGIPPRSSAGSASAGGSLAKSRSVAVLPTVSEAAAYVGSAAVNPTAITRPSADVLRLKTPASARAVSAVERRVASAREEELRSVRDLPERVPTGLSRAGSASLLQTK